MNPIAIAEYGSINPQEYGKKIVLDEGTKGRTTYQLIHRTAGYQCAGSCARYDAEGWGVIFNKCGASHGRWFKSESAARELFAQWTA